MKKQVVFLGLLLALVMPSWGQMRLAVLEPEGKGLSAEERWMLSLIQSSITGDFNRYSAGAITIIDRQNLEVIIAEQKRSLEAMTSDDDSEAIRIGNLANANYVLSGRVTKTPNAFMLELAITNVETGVRVASYSPRAVTPNALENLSALKEASSDLLKQLGVKLTDNQLAELRGPVTTVQIQAQTALAHGVVAQRQGTSVAALSYYYQAAAFDPTLVEAVNRSYVMSANISGTNLGENIRNDIIWRKNWVQNLKETEETFYKIIASATPPYTLFYSTGIETKNINYQKESADLSIPINLTANAEWFNAMQRALQAADAVLVGLNATGRKSDWGLSNWPGQGVSNTNPFASWSSSWRREISVEFELVDQHGKVIGRQTVRLNPSFSVGNRHGDRFSIDFTENTSNTLTFNAVKAEDISDNLTIRPALVNGRPPETAGFPITAISAEKRKDDLAWHVEKGILMGFADKRAQHSSIVIPSEVFGQTITAIGDKAFENSNLTSVIIPNSITSIGKKAFANNELTSVTIPKSVTSIGAGAFEKNKLTSIVIPNSISNIEEKTFANNRLPNVTIPNSVTSIGAGAFEKNKLTSIVIPNSVRIIGDGAFAFSYTTKYYSWSNGSYNAIDEVFNAIKQVTIGERVKIGKSGIYNAVHAEPDLDEKDIRVYNTFGQVYQEYNYRAGTYNFGTLKWEKVAETEADVKIQKDKKISDIISATVGVLLVLGVLLFI